MDKNKQLIIIEYYKDNGKKIKAMVNVIIKKFGGLFDKDMDDFYSLANEVFTYVIANYDLDLPFDKYLFSCLSNKIKTEITKRNRYKRTTDRVSISIDTPLQEGNDVTIKDVIADSYDLETSIIGRGYSNKMERYLNNLSKKQRTVVLMLAESYKPNTIKEYLNISQREYNDILLAIHSYDNISILFEKED